MNTRNWAIIKALLIVAVVGASIGPLVGCQESYTEAECWDKVLPRDPNMAAGMADMEKARTEAATEAKIKLVNHAVFLSCNILTWVCLGILLLGIYLKSKLIVISSIGGAIIFTVAAFWMQAYATYPKTIAAVGLAIMLSILATFVVIVIMNRKALTQVVLGNENYKGRLVSDNGIFANEHEKIQTPTTTKIVDKIRNGGSK